MESCMLHLHKVGETENVYICMYFMYKGEVQNSFWHLLQYIYFCCSFDIYC